MSYLPDRRLTGTQPPGNVGGEYGANIGAPLGHPNIKGTSRVNEAAILSSYNAATGQNE